MPNGAPVPWEPVVLAAGLARRMGEAKLVLPLADRPVLTHTVEHVHHLTGRRPYVVIPPDGPVWALAEARGWRRVVNPDPARGMASSLQAAVSALGDRAVLVFLGDQPGVPASAVRGVLELADRLPALWAVQVRYRGVPGHPVLLRPPVYPAILGLRGDEGARRVLEALSPDALGRVEQDAPPPADLDTPDDYAAWQRSRAAWQASGGDKGRGREDV